MDVVNVKPEDRDKIPQTLWGIKIVKVRGVYCRHGNLTTLFCTNIYGAVDPVDFKCPQCEAERQKFEEKKAGEHAREWEYILNHIRSYPNEPDRP